MADIESAIKTYLQTSSTLTGLIAKRLYTVKAPQEKLDPYVVYNVISDPDEKYYVGKDGSNPLFQFDIISKTFANAKLIDNEIRRLLQDYQGTISGVVVTRIICTGYREYEDLQDYIRLQRDFEVTYNR